MTGPLKPGDKVMLTDRCCARKRFRGRVLTVASRPWLCGDREVVMLKGLTGAYAVEDLIKVEK